MTTLTPEKTTGERCGEMVSQGMVSYRCELATNHNQKPADDPEPHYAVEVGASTRRWQAWKQRQLQRASNPNREIVQGVACPGCGGPLYIDGSLARCEKESCKVDAIAIAPARGVEESPEPMSAEAALAEYAATANDGRLPPDDEGLTIAKTLAQKPAADAHWEDVTDTDRSPNLELVPCPRTIRHDHHFWGLKDESPVYQCLGEPKEGTDFASTPDGEVETVVPEPSPSATSDLAEFVEEHRAAPSAYDEIPIKPDERLHTRVDRPTTLPDPGPPVEGMFYGPDDAPWLQPAEPSKQREGDQDLPEGGYACVQDAVIAEMEASKTVGMQRYGTHLMTFNGRKGIQDVQEEARDLFVYLTQIKMESEVTRAQLEIVVANRIRPLITASDTEAEEAAGRIATIAVDAVMGWVTGQQPATG